MIRYPATKVQKLLSAIIIVSALVHSRDVAGKETDSNNQTMQWYSQEWVQWCPAHPQALKKHYGSGPVRWPCTQDM